MDRKYVEYSVEMAEKLIAIDSPTGYTAKAAAWVEKEFKDLGFATRITNKGGVLVDLGGEDSSDVILLMTHLDTIGAMVAEIKANGRLRMSPLGGLHAPGLEG